MEAAGIDYHVRQIEVLQSKPYRPQTSINGDPERGLGWSARPAFVSVRPYCYQNCYQGMSAT